MSGEKTQVEARDESLKNSDIGDHEEDKTVIADPNARCFWNGTECADGAAVCAEGVTYECHFSSWMKMPDSC